MPVSKVRNDACSLMCFLPGGGRNVGIGLPAAPEFSIQRLAYHTGAGLAPAGIHDLA